MYTLVINTSFKAILYIATDKDMQVKGTLNVGTLQPSTQAHTHICCDTLTTDTKIQSFPGPLGDAHSLYPFLKLFL